MNRPFAKTLESLLRQRLATRITLRRLSESGVHELLAKMSGSAPPSGLTHAVFRETEGNVVLTMSEGEWSGRAHAFYDLFRMHNGQGVGLANTNGMFSFK